MNSKLTKSINSFAHYVANYINQEYDAVYYERLIEGDFFNFIGSYYMGGSTVPDTARYVVELILMKEKDKNNEKSL